MKRRFRVPTLRFSTARFNSLITRVRGAGTSLLLHAMLLAMLFLLTFDIPRPTKVVRISAELPEQALLVPEFLETNELDVIAPNAGLKTPATGNPDGVASEAPDPKETLKRPPTESRQTALSRIEATSPTRPISHLPADIGLGDVLEGIAGPTVHTQSVAGSVNRITREILRQLTKGPVLVVWIFDSSGSLVERREEVIDRFDRVNRELDELGKMREDLLLNAVVGFGANPRFVTEKPVASFSALQDAVRSIEPDQSGQERVFSAVRAAAQKYRRYQTHGRRNIMMIAVTDEAGDDLEVVDDCIQLVRRNRIPVYVLGPVAPFGRKSIDVTWVDEPTGEVFMIPIDRGPESIQPEHLALPYWAQGPQYDVFPSGFGPFGLTLLARRSGGIYFLFDDQKIDGPKFEPERITPYAPEYVTLADYAKTVAKHPLRRAIVQVVQMSHDALGQPRMAFPADRLNESLSEAQRSAAQTAHVVDRGIAILSQVEKDRKDETSRRWQAHFDLILGRLLATRIRANEYNWALAQMKVNPLPTDDQNNFWRLVADEQVRFGKAFTSEEDSRKAKRDPKITQQAKADAERAIALLESVVAEHAGTPWELLARRELDVPLGFSWEQFYIPPPPPPPEVTPDPNPQPPRVNPRDEAAKRVPKL